MLSKFKKRYLHMTALVVLIAVTFTFLFISNKNNSFEAWHEQQQKQYENTEEASQETSVKSGDESVYIAADNGYLHKINTKTGKLIWKAEGYMWPTYPPVFDNQYVYVLKNYFKDKNINHSLEGEVYGINKDTGEKEWSFLSKTGWVIVPPALDNKNVYIGSMDGKLYCVTKKDNAVKWEFTADSAVFSTPVISSNNILFTTNEGYLYCLNIKTGNMDWKAEINKDTSESPVIVDKKVILSSYDTLYAFNLSNGKQIYKEEFEEKITPPAIGKKVMYVATSSGKIYEIEISSGDINNQIFEAKGEIPHSPMYSDGNLYFSMEGSKLIALSLSGNRQRELWTYKGSGNFSPLSTTDKYIYIGNDGGKLLAVDRQSGKAEWEYNTKSQILTKPAIEKKALGFFQRILRFLGL